MHDSTFCTACLLTSDIDYVIPLFLKLRLFVIATVFFYKVLNLTMSSSAVDTKSSKKYKVVKGGLEYPSNVIYGSWEPGGEYTLPLTLKNIKLTTQKLKFR